MDAWDKLHRELDHWGETERAATLWWRDDDAVDVTRPLNDLLEISQRYDVSIMLAVVPAHLTPAFHAHRFNTRVRLAQHGYAHVNHAPANAKKSEFNVERDISCSMTDITEGHRTVMGLENAINAFVPPWNRIDAALFQPMHDIGIAAVSTFTARQQAEPASGLRQVNTHADIVDWRGARCFAGTDHVVGQVVDHLEKRRLGMVDRDEPTGLLTHHLIHDDACWEFIDTFVAYTTKHTAARWLSIDEALAA